MEYGCNFLRMWVFNVVVKRFGGINEALLMTISFAIQMGRKSILAGLAGFTVLVGCSTFITSARIETITLGSGGGFTGMRTGYRIERSGLVEEWDMLRDSVRLRATVKIPASRVREYFARAEALRLDTLHFDKPGNISFWLEIRTNAAITRLRWSSDTHLPHEIAAFYRDLLSLCQEHIERK